MLLPEEVTRANKIVEIIEEMESHPADLMFWNMRFDIGQYEQVVRVLSNLEEYSDATPESLSYLVNAMAKFLADLTPKGNWSTNHISIGREYSRVVYFHISQSISYAADLPVVKDRIAEIARLARVSELHYQEEKLQKVPGDAAAPIVDYFLWRTKIRFWWD